MTEHTDGAGDEPRDVTEAEAAAPSWITGTLYEPWHEYQLLMGPTPKGRKQHPPESAPDDREVSRRFPEWRIFRRCVCKLFGQFNAGTVDQTLERLACEHPAAGNDRDLALGLPFDDAVDFLQRESGDKRDKRERSCIGNGKTNLFWIADELEQLEQTHADNLAHLNGDRRAELFRMHDDDNAEENLQIERDKIERAYRMNLRGKWESARWFIWGAPWRAADDFGGAAVWLQQQQHPADSAPFGCRMAAAIRKYADKERNRETADDLGRLIETAALRMRDEQYLLKLLRGFNGINVMRPDGLNGELLNRAARDVWGGNLLVVDEVTEGFRRIITFQHRDGVVTEFTMVRGDFKAHDCPDTDTVKAAINAVESWRFAPQPATAPTQSERIPDSTAAARLKQIAGDIEALRDRFEGVTFDVWYQRAENEPGERVNLSPDHETEVDTARRKRLERNALLELSEKYEACRRIVPELPHDPRARDRGAFNLIAAWLHSMEPEANCLFREAVDPFGSLAACILRLARLLEAPDVSLAERIKAVADRVEAATNVWKLRILRDIPANSEAGWDAAIINILAVQSGLTTSDRQPVVEEKIGERIYLTFRHLDQSYHPVRLQSGGKDPVDLDDLDSIPHALIHLRSWIPHTQAAEFVEDLNRRADEAKPAPASNATVTTTVKESDPQADTSTPKNRKVVFAGGTDAVPDKFKHEGRPCGPIVGTKKELAHAAAVILGAAVDVRNVAQAHEHGMAFVRQKRPQLLELFCTSMREFHDAQAAVNAAKTAGNSTKKPKRA